MPSTILDPIATALKAFVTAQGLTAYKWPKGDYETPAGVVELPTINRTGVDEPESQIGSNDWRLSYPVALYFELSESTESHALAVNGVEAFILAVDADPSLGDPEIVADAKVTSAVPEYDDEQPRAHIIYVCTVELLKLV